MKLGAVGAVVGMGFFPRCAVGLRLRGFWGIEELELGGQVVMDR